MGKKRRAKAKRKNNPKSPPTNYKYKALAALVALAAGYTASYYSKPHFFERRFDVSTIPKQVVPQSRRRYHDLPPHHILREKLQEVIMQLPDRGASITGKIFKGLYSTRLVQLDPDPIQARSIVLEAHKSIDDIFDYLDHDALVRPKVDIVVPESVDEINYDLNDITIYFVALYGKRMDFEYELQFPDKITPIIIAEVEGGNEGGESVRTYKLKREDIGFSVENTRYRPIYCTTFVKHSPILVESPAIEVLHLAVAKVSKHNLENKLSYDMPGLAAQKITNIFLDREEVFVHALAKLWLIQYNSKRGFNFTKEQLDEQFARYDKPSHLQYNGTNEMADHIQDIGIRKAIDLYINNPDELFKILD